MLSSMSPHVYIRLPTAVRIQSLSQQCSDVWWEQPSKESRNCALSTAWAGLDSVNWREGEMVECH
jgi:hypothetical protein